MLLSLFLTDVICNPEEVNHNAGRDIIINNLHFNVEIISDSDEVTIKKLLNSPTKKYKTEDFRVDMPEEVEIEFKKYKITKIDRECFKSSSVETIKLPKTVLFIGDSCFFNCQKLEYVNIADTQIQSIEQYTFCNCRALSDIILPISLNFFRKYSFLNCSSLQMIKSDSTFTVEDGAFQNCEILSSFPIFNLVGPLGKYSLSNTGITSANLPNTVTSISEGCFMNCSRLKKVSFQIYFSVIPKSFVENDKKLQEFIMFGFPNQIEERAFANSGILNFTFENIQKIGPCAFYNCTDIKKVDLKQSKVTFIPKYSFSNCKSLETVVLNDITTSIGKWAFAFSQISSIIFTNKISKIRKFAFYSSSIQTIEFNSSQSVSISKFAFSCCNSLISCDFSDSVSKIGLGAFENSTLISVVLRKSVNSLKKNVFYQNRNLISADLSKTQLETLPQCTFYKCFSLMELKLPKTMKNLEDLSLAYTELRNITFHKNIKTFGKQIFSNCRQLNEINLSSTQLKEIGESTFEYSSVTTVIIPKTMTTISKMAFYYSSIQNLKLSPNIKQICYFAFGFCEKLNYINLNDTSVVNITKKSFFGSGLNEIILPDCCKRIEGSAFKRSKLVTVKLSKNIDHIGTKSFMACLSLVSINLEVIQCKYIARKAFKNTISLVNLSLPEEFEILNVESFFRTGVQYIKFNESLSEIGTQCFACSKLREIDLSETKIHKIPDGLFFLATDLYLVKLPYKLTETGTYSFFMNPIQKIVFPPGVQKFASNTIMWCPYLKEIEMSRIHNAYLSKFIFSHLHSLSLIVMPTTYINADRQFINDCPAITEIVYNSSVYMNWPRCFPIKAIAYVNRHYKGETFMGATPKRIIRNVSSLHSVPMKIEINFTHNSRQFNTWRISNNIKQIQVDGIYTNLSEIVRNLLNSSFDEPPPYIDPDSLVENITALTFHDCVDFNLREILIAFCLVIYGIIVLVDRKCIRRRPTYYVKPGIVW